MVASALAWVVVTHSVVRVPVFSLSELGLRGNNRSTFRQLGTTKGQYEVNFETSALAWEEVTHALVHVLVF